MKIGIVTPSFNQGRYIEATIKSVLNQTRPVNYYAIYDSCSTDITSEILNRYKNNSGVSKIVIEKDKGQTDAIDRGFREMPQDIEIMAYLNSDDLLPPDAIETVMKLFENHSDVDFITGWRRLLGPRGRIGMVIPSFPRNSEDFYINAGINQEASFWRKTLYDKAGGRMNSSLQFAMGFDLWFRMREAPWNPLYVKNILGYYRVHTAAKSSTEIETTGIREINLLRTNRNLPALTRQDFRKAVKRIEGKEKGFLWFWFWRVQWQITKRLLLPFYL